MFDRIDRAVRERFVLAAWFVLLAAYLAKGTLLLTGAEFSDFRVIGSSLVEEALWVLLQPLGVMVYTLRHWRWMRFSQRLVSFGWFWLPVTFLVAVYCRKAAIVLTYGVPDGLSSKYDVALELLWVYFPIAGTISWYLRRWEKATENERWRSKYMFLPVVGTLYSTFLIKWTGLLLFDLPADGCFTFVTNHIEELLWVAYPGLGIWAERKSRDRQPFAAAP